MPTTQSIRTIFEFIGYIISASIIILFSGNKLAEIMPMIFSSEKSVFVAITILGLCILWGVTGFLIGRYYERKQQQTKNNQTKKN